MLIGLEYEYFFGVMKNFTDIILHIPHSSGRIEEDDFACLRVDLKASTSLCGRRLTKPTVSTRIAVWPLGSTNLRAVGSNVAKSISFSKISLLVIRLSRLDLPTLV